MKNTLLKLSAVIIIITGFAFTFLKPGSVTGKVTPADAVKDVWAISSKDTVIGMVTDGSFTIAVSKPGTYSIVIHATTPYKDVIKKGVLVPEGEPVDIGEITLEK